MQTEVTRLNRFANDERGTVAIIFALSAMALIAVVGLAIDGGRAYSASSKVRNAVDAAVLAAAREMRESNLNDAQVTAVARKFFMQNMKLSGTSDFAIGGFNVEVNRANSSVAITVDGHVPTTMGQLAGVRRLSVPGYSLAVFKSKNIELGMSLDMTGSMRGSKMSALKAATHDLIDIMIPDRAQANSVRIGFAPYAAGVNAGDYASASSNNRSPDGCVYERLGADQNSMDAPSPGNFMSTRRDLRRAYRCPSRSRVLALTADKDILHSNVDDFSTGGSTAGHLGTAWAGYLLSPAWASVFPSSAEPAPIGDANTIKAVILMTDGEYNTFGGRWGGARRSGAAARALCQQIKGQRTVVYAIGFELRNREAISILQDCASTAAHFFRAENGDQLREVFRSIAIRLSSLRLAK